jgi:hypothetical protein
VENSSIASLSPLDEVSVQIQTPETFLPRKEHQEPWGRKLDGPQIWSGWGKKEKNLCPEWECSLRRPAHCLVSIRTSLARNGLETVLKAA